MMNKTILMLSASCMSIIAGADWCCADFNHFDTSPSFIPAGVKSHVSTHTSHLTAGHLSSPEDFAELTLPENSGRDREGFKPSLTLPNSLGREEKGEKIKLAAACFVTDTTNCSGNEFGGNNADEDDGGVPPGGDDYDLDNAERCRQEGYNQTSCPEGQEPSNFCPYDSNYFEKCVSSCPSNYVTCEDGFQGVGEACGGKYASCCNTCEGFDYVTIPDGYVQDGAFCSGCDGIKYKVKCDPSQYTQCTSGGTGTCTDDYGTYYKECDCPANYEWDNVSKSCVCSTIYKYNCVGEHITGGDGQSCDNQYAGCKCETGYVWDDAQGKCVSTCQGIDWCTLTPDCAALGYAQQSCTGKSVKCPFNTSFSYCLD